MRTRAVVTCVRQLAGTGSPRVVPAREHAYVRSMNAPNLARTVAMTAGGPVDAAGTFVSVERQIGEVGPRDLLVRVHAVSVNPVDLKQRDSYDGSDGARVLGYDAAGTVVAVGGGVSFFEVGDDVYYAGSLSRSGSNTDHQLVDERLVGHKPSALDFAEAAAVPLTLLTAWEALFERFRLGARSTGTLLVTGAAGGVGSMVVQLARRLTDVEVVAAASRPESEEWSLDLGAHRTVDRHRLREEVGPDAVDHLFSPFSAGMVPLYAELLRVRGDVVAIDEPEGLDLLPFKAKSQGWLWEFVFTRPLHEEESTAHHDVLEQAAGLFDSGVLRTTLSRRAGPLSPSVLREAHRAVEGHGMVGKFVVTAEE